MNDRPCTELDEYLDRLTIDEIRDSRSVLSTSEKQSCISKDQYFKSLLDVI